ncbi:MAG: hypothetical protein R2883_03585 [Caldisericia bacterium]
MHIPSSINATALFKPTSISGGWVEEPFSCSIDIKNVSGSDVILFVDKLIEGEKAPLEFDKLDIPAGETYKYKFTLGDDAEKGENTGYLVFSDGKNTARVAYLYYYGREQKLMLSHI